MFDMNQFVAHLVGDYLLQQHWMSQLKRKEHLAAALHAATYGIPFLLITLSIPALLVIVGTHFLIDRYGLARYVVAFKNQPAEVAAWAYDSAFRRHLLAGRRSPITATGYPEDTPPFLAVWLLIIADNTLHVLINGAAIHYLG